VSILSFVSSLRKSVADLVIIVMILYGALALMDDVLQQRGVYDEVGKRDTDTPCERFDKVAFR